MLEKLRRRKADTVAGEVRPTEFVLGGKIYAIGLSWFAVPTAQLKREISTLAAEAGDDLYVVRPAKSLPQFSLAAQAAGYRPGMVAAAAAAARSNPGDWAAVVALPDERYWFVALDHDRLTSSDRVFASKGAALDHLRTYIEEKAPTSIYAPEGSGIETAKALGIEDLIGRGKGYRLAPLKPSASRFMLPIGILVLGGATAYGGYVWLEAKASAERAEAIRRQQLASQQRALASYRAPWLTAPNPEAFATACEAAIDRAFLPVPGWRLAELRCEANKVIVEWRSSGGRVDWLAGEFRSSLGAEPRQIEQSGKNVRFEIPIPVDTSRAPLPPLLAGTDAASALFHVVQAVGATVNVEQTAEFRPQAPAGTQNPPPAPIFRFRNFAVQTRLPLNEWRPLLRLPGLILTSAALNAETDEWAIRGILYEKP